MVNNIIKCTHCKKKNTLSCALLTWHIKVIFYHVGQSALTGTIYSNLIN